MTSLSGHLLKTPLAGMDLQKLLTPAEQAEVVADGGREVAALLVVLDEGALVALGHLARAVGLEDERDVGVLRRFDAEGLEELGFST